MGPVALRRLGFSIYARYMRGADNLVDSVGDPFPRSV